MVDPAAHADGQGIHCIIHHVPISSPGSFTALSYKWGNPEKHSNMLVQSEAGLQLGNIPLTKNLGNALKDLQDTDAIQRKVFWIDQICINQDDIHERGKQVVIMGEIYTSAMQVITYLGLRSLEMPAEAIALMMIIDAHFERGSIYGAWTPTYNFGGEFLSFRK